MPRFKRRTRSLRNLFYPALISVPLILLGCQPKELTLARVHIENENWDQALEILERATAAHPDNAEVHFLFGKALGERARFVEMKKSFQKSLQISDKFSRQISNEIEKNWTKCFNAGVKAQSDQDLDLAEKLFRTAMAIDSSRKEAFQRLGESYIQGNQPNKALLVYNNWLKKNPTDIDFLVAIGGIYYKEQKFEETIKSLRKVLELEPGHRDALANLALSYDAMDKPEKAFLAYQKALQQNPEDKELISLLGLHHYRNGHFVKAIEVFERILELTPGDFDAILNISNSYLSMAEGLREQLRKAANGSMNLDELQKIRTEAILNYKKGIPYLEKALQLQPHHPMLWQNLGVAYINSGEPQKGQQAFLKAEEWRSKLSDDSE